MQCKVDTDFKTITVIRFPQTIIGWQHFSSSSSNNSNTATINSSRTKPYHTTQPNIPPFPPPPQPTPLTLLLHRVERITDNQRTPVHVGREHEGRFPHPLHHRPGLVLQLARPPREVVREVPVEVLAAGALPAEADAAVNLRRPGEAVRVHGGHNVDAGRVQEPGHLGVLAEVVP